MDFLWTKQSCILDNVVNAETPNYKTKYVTFEESLQQAVQSAYSDSTSAVKEMRDAIQGASISVQEAEESTRMDENGVNITEQMVELTRNGYQLQYVMNAISSDLTLIRTAITG